MLISAVHHEEGEEKLHLLMLDNHIPAGAKMLLIGSQRTEYAKSKEALIKSARAGGKRFAAQPGTIYSEVP